MKRVLGLLAAVAIALAGSACTGGESHDDAARLRLDGRATLSGPGRHAELRTGSYTLRPGEMVEVNLGEAVVALPGGATIELRAGRAGARDSRLALASVPALLAGEALVVAADGRTALDVAGTRFELAPGGAAKAARETGSRFAVYREAATVTSAGRTLPGGLPALRQITVTGTGLLPLEPSPLRYDADEPDPWDQRFLGAGIELGRRLDQLSRGYTRALADDGSAPTATLRLALPPLRAEPGFDASLIEGDRTMGELLVGAAIAVVGEEGTFTSRWAEVFDFRDDGATWGLVALDQRADRETLLGLLDQAADRSPILFAIGGPGSATGATPLPTAPVAPTSPPPGGPTPPPGPGPDGGPDGDGDGDGDGRDRDGDDDDGGDGDLIPTVPDPLEPIVDPVDELLGSIISQTGSVGTGGLLGG